MPVRRYRVVVTSLLAVALGAALAACQPSSAPYVALGDSYTAGPLIPNQSLEPLGCLRSTNSWPALVGRQAGTAVLDVSCSGARTRHMFTEQDVTPGPNRPQLDALRSDTRVVSLQIGGNDIGFSSIIQDCAALTPWDRPCRDDFVGPGGDQLAERIARTEPDVVAVIDAIRAKSPSARVIVTGYPAILPESGSGCWPQMPLVGADVTYLRGVHKQLNAMIASAAASAGATYVDIYGPSIGRDACRGSSTRWVEPIVPATGAAPVHPNLNGMRGIAAVVAPHIQAAL